MGKKPDEIRDEAVESTEAHPVPDAGVQRALADRLQILLANAPVDDEPFDPADLKEDEDEPLIPHEEVVRRHHE